MRKRIAVCFVVVFASMFGATACGGGQQQERVDRLEDQVDLLEERVEEIQVLLGMELAEEPANEQTTGGETMIGGETTIGGGTTAGGGATDQ